MARGPRPRYSRQIAVPVPSTVRAKVIELAELHDRLLSEVIRDAFDAHLADPRGPDDDHPALLQSPYDGDLVSLVRPHVADGLRALATANGRTVGGEARIALQRYLVGCGIDGHREDDTLLTV